jgi:hypothetical protein
VISTEYAVGITSVPWSQVDAWHRAAVGSASSELTGSPSALSDDQVRIQHLHLPIIHQHSTVDDRRCHVATTDCVGELANGVAAWQMTWIGQVEQDQVGSFARLEAADLSLEAERPGPANRG